MLIYTIGRSHLLELFHSELQSDLVRMVDGPMSRRAYEQLMNLETQLRESGTVYTCPANMTTSASPAPCWPGRRSTRICGTGPARSGPADATRANNSIGTSSHDHPRAAVALTASALPAQPVEQRRAYVADPSRHGCGPPRRRTRQPFGWTSFV